jgi:hypothetical protein
MNYPFSMTVLNHFDQLSKNLLGFVFCQLLTFLETTFQIASRDVFHNQEKLTLVNKHILELNDFGMIQFLEHFCLFKDLVGETCAVNTEL